MYSAVCDFGASKTLNNNGSGLVTMTFIIGSFLILDHPSNEMPTDEALSEKRRKKNIGLYTF